jgi:ADP-ribosylglycohydrolase
MCHYFIHNLGPKIEIGKYLESLVPSKKWSEPWQGKIGAQGWMDVRAAVTVIQEENSTADILKRIVSFTGDTDTAAAIAMAAASQCKELKQNLPDNLYRDLENGSYGRNYLGEISKWLTLL